MLGLKGFHISNNCRVYVMGLNIDGMGFQMLHMHVCGVSELPNLIVKG